MNKNQTLLPLKGFYYSFLAFVLLLSSCDKDIKTSDGNQKNQVVEKNSDGIGYSKVPEFAGTWVSENGDTEIKITKVHDKLYDLEMINGEYWEDYQNFLVSGSYSLSSDFTHISLEQEAGPSHRRKNVVLEFHYSEDGRLYWSNNNVFYKRAK